MRLRGEEEELDRAEKVIREFQAENWTTETAVALDDEVRTCSERVEQRYRCTIEPLLLRHRVAGLLYSSPLQDVSI